MILTTKGRYAVISLLDIAILEQTNPKQASPVSLGNIALRQNISVNYLEQIFNKLRCANLVRSIKGPGGGYVLARPTEEISIKQIIEAVGESFEMTRCGNNPEKNCHAKNTKCFTHDLWNNLSAKINQYLNDISIKDVIENNLSIENV
jgi:Rrf2 family iron-sulfur cluster assembly transcriptional regulator